jgi:hypothetical protein
MFREILFGVACLLVSVAATLAQQPVQQSPHACMSIDEDAPPPGLKSSYGNVIAAKVQIMHNQKAYYIRVYSDTAPKPQERFDQCFRYEAENEGLGAVRSFYWELGGIWADPFHPRPEDRRSRSIVRAVDDTPRPVPTRVFAFENEWGDTKAWAPVPRQPSQQSTGQGAAGKGWPWFGSVDHSSIVAGLEDFLKNNRLPQGLVLAYHFDEPHLRASTLQDIYTAPGIKVELRSDAVRKDDQIVLSVEVMATGSAAHTARYVMPALRAMWHPEATVLDLTAYNEFLDRFRSVAREAEPYRERWVFNTSIPVSVLPERVVYRIIHPIAIERKNGERDCFLAASYSPLALSFSLQQCPLLSRESPR